jgi:hypothetical protein
MRPNPPAPLNDSLLLDMEFDDLGNFPIEGAGHHEAEDDWNDELLLEKA